MARVLAAIDGSEHAMNALAHAAAILGDSTEWVLLSILPPWSPAVAISLNEDLDDDGDAAPDDAVDDHRAEADDALVDYYRSAQDEAATRAGIEGEHVIDEAKPQKRKVGRAICDAVAAHGADLIVIGSHGSSHAGEVLLGSVSQYVLHHASCPVLTVRHHD
ncbi:MAG: universal stress protein [Ilumatobacteraceae bacterium]